MKRNLQITLYFFHFTCADDLIIRIKLCVITLFQDHRCNSTEQKLHFVTVQNTKCILYMVSRKDSNSSALCNNSKERTQSDGKILPAHVKLSTMQNKLLK